MLNWVVFGEYATWGESEAVEGELSMGLLLLLLAWLEPLTLLQLLVPLLLPLFSKDAENDIGTALVLEMGADAEVEVCTGDELKPWVAADFAPLDFDVAVRTDVIVACDVRLEASCSISFKILLILALEKE